MHQPYNVETFGIFRNIMLEGDFTGKVALSAVMAKHPSTGVGAVADARGEVTVYGGKLIVSYGKAGAAQQADRDCAALMITASAGEWQPVAVERNVAPADIESFIAAAAKAHGLDADRSFPYELTGAIISYVMHVNAAPTGGPHGMGRPMAVTVESKGDEIAGSVAGLYVAADLVGIATHGGERTHSHFVAADGASTAHLDRWGIKAGSVLMLPKPARAAKR